MADAIESGESLLRPHEAAAALGVHRDTLLGYRRGVVVGGRLVVLPAVPCGAQQYRYRAADVAAFVASLREARGLAAAPAVGPRPETDAEFARRAARDVDAFNRGR